MSKIKEKYPDISTKRSQRIAIWIICIVMAIGFLAGLFVWVLAIVNPSTNPSQITHDKALQEYEKQLAAEEATETAASLNYEVFGGYEMSVFDAATVTDLTVETLREGDGAEVVMTDTISAYYTGWTPTGTIFDSTKSINAENEARSFSLEQVITGWTEGLSGKKVGGVYQLTIPSDKAYGEYGSGSLIPANTPLRFIIEIIGIE